MGGKKTILFDVTRLLIRMSLSSPTGIDRVGEAYADWLLAKTDIELVPVCSWGGVLWPMARSSVHRMISNKASRAKPSGKSWSQLCRALNEPAIERAGLRAKNAKGRLKATVSRYVPAVLRTLVHWRPKRISNEALYLNVSHFGLEQPKVLDRLTAKGIRSVVMVHDLIPIAYPEFCSPSGARLHLRRIEAVLEHAHLVITNSQATATDLEAFASQMGARTPPTCVAELGFDAAFLHPSQNEPLAAPYFVCVGTLEPRKNLTFLLMLWRRLAAKLGDETPFLILAGKRGWENESIIDQLERSPAILRFVHEADDLDDDQLAQLIGGARALLAPSFSEGFNLPVGEAIALGTPVIASDIPVHRELAPEARLIDPIDGPGWLTAIEEASKCPPTTKAARGQSWVEHFAIVARTLDIPNGCGDSTQGIIDPVAQPYPSPQTHEDNNASQPVEAKRALQRGRSCQTIV